MTNREFTKDIFFRKCCERMDILPTVRQGSKFLMNKGLAFSVSKRIKFEEKNEHQKS